MNYRSSAQVRKALPVEDIIKKPKVSVTRRVLLKMGMAGATATALASLDALAWQPQRAAQAATTVYPNIQFDINNFIAPIQTYSGVQFHFGPILTVFLPATLKRTPTKSDQAVLANALDTIEAVYAYSPAGIFTFVSYGLPYFSKLPGGLAGRLVRRHMPRLLADPCRYALEEAVPGPTDVTPGGSITKATYTIPVAIEANDVLFTFRTDSQHNVVDVVSWLQGSNTLGGVTMPSPDLGGLFAFGELRASFTQIGLVRQFAERNHLPYASRINPQAPMWMGFADQQVAASGPASIVTFQGNRSARFTDATEENYFADGSIQHLSHVIEDLAQFYKDPDEPYSERIQYMFRSDPIPALGNSDQFTDGGGPVFFENDASSLKRFPRGVSEASVTGLDPGPVGDDRNPFNDPQPATSPDPADVGKRRPRMGHLPALQQSSRAKDGTPIHIRIDGPGFDTLDVPDGSGQPKLHFSIFVPSAEFFRAMRENQAALRYQAPVDANGKPTGPGVHPNKNGLERFITTTRRQNFLVPPRSHRAFPLLELSEDD